jgi:hypothetical protein
MRFPEMDYIEHRSSQTHTRKGEGFKLLYTTLISSYVLKLTEVAFGQRHCRIQRSSASTDTSGFINCQSQSSSDLDVRSGWRFPSFVERCGPHLSGTHGGNRGGQQ